MLRRATILAALLLAVTPVAARATTYYAVAHGSGSGTECPLGAECSLPHAVSLAKDGDSIVLQPGPAFTPPSELNIKYAIDIGGVPGASRPTILAAEEEGVMELTGGGHLHDVNLVAGDAFEALELIGSSAERIAVETTGLNTRACLLYNSTLLDSVCRSQGSPAVEVQGVNESFSARLRNVTALSAADIGIQLLAPGKFHETRLEGVNVIARGGPGQFDVSAVGGEGAAVVVLAGSDYATTQVVGAEASVTQPGTGGNITAAPLFVNEAAGDLHELPGSPTVDAGSTDPSVASLDLDGGPRALSAHPTCASLAGPTDIGAYEYVPPAPTCAPPPAGGGEKSAPPPPGTKLGKVKIDAAAGLAHLTFAGTGSVSGFACELMRPAPRGAKKPKRRKATFAGCKSPKTYKHLKPGRYTFEVKASGPGGTDPTPAKREFTIRR